MDTEILGLLKSAHVDDRKEAIKLLARTESDEALRYLARVYQDDPDSEVRDLALKAGQYIKKRQHSGGWEAEVGHEPYYEDEYEDESFVSQKDIDRASNVLERCVDALMADRKQEAAELAQEALALNPDLANDPYFVNIAGDIMNIEGDAAVSALQRMELGQSDKQKAKRKRGTTSDDPDAVGWGTAFADLGILGLITGLLVAAMTFFFVRATTQAVTLVSTDYLASIGYGTGGVESDALAVVLATLASLSLPMAIFLGVLAGVGLIIYQLIWMALIHGVATMMFSGAGSLPGFIHRMTVPIMIFNVVPMILLAAQGFFYAQNMDVAGAEALLIGDVASFDGYVPPILLTLSEVFQYTGIIFTVWVLYIIEKHYDFGWGRGCISLLVSQVLFVALGVGCILTMMTLLSGG